MFPQQSTHPRSQRRFVQTDNNDDQPQQGDVSPEEYYRNAQQGRYYQQSTSQQSTQQQRGNPNLFDNLNDKLLELGIPRLDVMNTTLEPLHSVGIVLVMLYCGMGKLLLLAAIFYFMSRSNLNYDWLRGTVNRDPPPGGRDPPPGGRGRRLGRN